MSLSIIASMAHQQHYTRSGDTSVQKNHYVTVGVETREIFDGAYFPF